VKYILFALAAMLFFALLGVAIGAIAHSLHQHETGNQNEDSQEV
jgi:hypothetical protein